jgi:hypothetical protein
MAPELLVAAYERLREEVLALGPRAGACAGLGVFLSQGMEGWMSVVSFSWAVDPAPAPKPLDGSLARELPAGLAGAIVHHLAQMVLAHTEAR